MSYIQTYGPRFTYFDRNLDHPDWQDLKVLDFGGNVGNVLKDPNSRIQHKNYVCLDVSPSALKEGKAEFPDARWEFYDRWNPQFNPEGKRDAKIPDLGVFDIVLACSVFTHTLESEMIETIAELRKICRTLAFTIVTPENAVHVYKKHGVDVEAMSKNADGLDWFYYLNCEEILTQPPKVDSAPHFWYFCARQHIESLFPDVTFKPLVGTDTQNCCILPGYMCD